MVIKMTCKSNQNKKERQNKKWKEKFYKGTYTVEAAILIPMILFVMVGLLTASFYLHDRAVLQAAVCEISSAGSNAMSDKEQKKAIDEAKKRIKEGRLMGSKNLSGKADGDQTKVSASYKAQYPVPGMAAVFYPQRNIQISVSWEKETVEAADMIRKIRGVRKLVNGGSN